MAAWVIMSGSPYAQGKCVRVARAIADVLNDAPDDEARLYSVAELDIHGCIGCDSCRDTGRCVYEDDANQVQRALDEADAVLVISPIYFAGVPSQFKALLDRFQPYFWQRQALKAEGRDLPPKRPLILALVGEGGDPYGAEHAFAMLASPLALADLGVVAQKLFIRKDEDYILEHLQAVVDEIDEGVLE